MVIIQEKWRRQILTKIWFCLNSLKWGIFAKNRHFYIFLKNVSLVLPDFLHEYLKLFTLMGVLLSLHLFFIDFWLNSDDDLVSIHSFDYDKLVPRCFTRVLTVQSHWTGFYIFAYYNKFLLSCCYGLWFYIANGLVSIYLFIMTSSFPGVL